ncbi:MAG: hypothetical protein GIW95_09120, partial [Candidatus Eremiobacteraeota bacterium]|nr:hypothetical protein [Candidatus Eremiobacteraeota bacterium]
MLRLRWFALLGLGALLLLPMRSEAQYFGSTYGEVTFIPGHPIVLKIATPYQTRARVLFYRLRDAQVAAVKAAGRPLRPSDLASQKAWKTADSQTEDHGDYVNTVDLGTAPIGRYAAVWTLENSTAGKYLQFVNVTTLGAILVQETFDVTAVLAVDLRTDRQTKEVAFQLVTPSSSREFRPGADGFGRFAEKSGALVALAKDGSRAFASLPYSYRSSDSEQAVVQVDRPLVRPGQDVHYRAVVRTGGPGEFSIPTGTHVVRLSSGLRTLAEQAAPPDAFGTVNGTFTIPADAEPGYYRLTVFSDSSKERPSGEGGIQVENYRRPEYVVEAAPTAATFIGGQTASFRATVNYLFGRPAAGIAVHFRASASPDYYFAAMRGTPTSFRIRGEERPPSPAPIETPLEGTLAADSSGNVEIKVATKPVSDERRERLEVDVQDSSGYTVSTQADVRIVPASFYLRLGSDKFFVSAGDTVSLAIDSLDYLQKPRPAISVRLEFADLVYDRQLEQLTRTVIPSMTNVVRTDAAGAAHFVWRPAAPGLFEVTATAQDEAGRTAKTTQRLWVTGETRESVPPLEQVSMILQRQSYRPGEAARFLVRVPQAGVDAILGVESGLRRRLSVIRIPAKVWTLDVRPPADASNANVTLSIPDARGVISASARIFVDPAPHRLSVTITPDRSSYAPGSPATFALDVRNSAGRGVRSQVAVGVVDDALYALTFAGRRPYFYESFYGRNYFSSNEEQSWRELNAPSAAYVGGRQLVSIGRITTHSALQPGTTADVYSVGGPTFTNLRSDFRETAFWSPSVVTDDAGHATVTFRWPDSLTTFTTSAAAVTTATDLGDGTQKSLVTKDFLVRLEVPRFIRYGDSARIVGIAQGTPGQHGAELRLAAPQFGNADASASVAFDSFLSGSTDWTIRGLQLGTGIVRLAGASVNLRDGVEMPIGVQSAGVKEHLRLAGALPLEASVSLALPAGYDAGDLRVSVAPNALSDLAQDLHLLQVYPYYCTEQTLSAALPIAFLDRTMSKFGLTTRGPAPLLVVRRAVERLGELQHADGSWGWWQYDDANPMLTAYAVYGLSELHRAGYEVNDYRIRLGRDALLDQLKGADAEVFREWGGATGDAQYNVRAFMLFALSDDNKFFDRRLLADVDAHIAVMNPYALAVLGLAHHEATDDAGARLILQKLAARVTNDASYAHWESATWDYTWESDPVEATAYALRLYNAVDRTSPQIPKIVNWLRSQSRGSWWYTTKDTAAAISAIAETLDLAGDDLTPHETVRVALNGRLVKSLRFDSAFVKPEEASFTIPAATMAAGATLSFEREGQGNVLWSADWTRYGTRAVKSQRELPEDAMKRLRADGDPGMTIERRYAVARRGPWRLGDEVDVTVDVRVSRDRQFVAIEDPFPAGLEYQPLLHQAGSNWSGIQFFDDRAVFF